MSLVPRRLRALWKAQDQASVDADQTVSDSDQTSSDTDQSLSDRDQAAASSDQRVSDRDQAIADREFGGDSGAGDEEERASIYERAHAERDEGTMSRAATAAVRSVISGERDAQAERRDQNARERDQLAAERDQVTQLAEGEARELAAQVGELDPRATAALEAAASARSLAAAARAKAAADREKAARDREAAARDREFLQGEMERSQMDDVTGSCRRGLGEILLRLEMERANRSTGDLTLFFIDVDDLKQTNSASGHAAGDALLRSVNDGLQARLRPYDPIVRWGGDEFVCTITGVPLAAARERVEQACADLGALRPKTSVSVGFAAMEAGDTLAKLVARADAVMRETKRNRRRAADGD